MNKKNIKIEEIKSGDSKEEYKLKIVIVGDSGVGKTNLVKRFISNTFNSNSKATVGVEFLSKSYKINDHIFKIEIWDTAGQERYKSITAAYYKGAKGALVVYDTTLKETFNSVDKWISEIREKSIPEIKLMIIGNKIDLKDRREVKLEEAIEKSKSLDVPIMETSALNATNVTQAFHDLLKEMYYEVRGKYDTQVENVEPTKEVITLNTDKNEPKKKSCC